jgi:hypothetical protein
MINKSVYKSLRQRDLSYGTLSALMTELCGSVPKLLIDMRELGSSDVFSDTSFIVLIMAEVGSLRSFSESVEDQSCMNYQQQAGQYTRRISAYIYLWFEFNKSLPVLLDFTSKEDLFDNLTPRKASGKMSQILAKIGVEKTEISSALAIVFYLSMMNMTDNVAVGKTLCEEDRDFLETVLHSFR